MYQKKLICEGVFLLKKRLICSLRRIWLIAIKYCVEIQRNNRKEKSWMQDKNMIFYKYLIRLILAVWHSQMFQI